MGIGDDVVVIRTAHRAGVAQPVDDDRRRPPGEKVGAGEIGVAVDIDQDVDAVAQNLLRRLGIAHGVDVDPMVDGASDPGLDEIRGVRAAIIDEHLDGGAVVQLENLGHQEANGVMAII